MAAAVRHHHVARRRLPTVDRTFQVRGNISFSTPSNWTLISKSMSVQFGPGGQLVAGSFPSGNNWQCTGTVNPSTPWGSMVQVTVNAQASFRFFRFLADRSSRP